MEECHADRVASEPRSQVPAGLPKVEPDGKPDLYRLYVDEWTIQATGTEAQCADHFDKKLRGRVADADWQIRLDTKINRFRLWVRLPVLKGEFKDPRDASRHARQIELLGADDYVIVTRNSPADHDLRNYGRRKLS